MYFSAALLLFAVIIGSVFMTLFKNNTIKLFKEDLEKRAVTMSETLSQFISGTATGGGMMQGGGMMPSGQGGYGAYIRFLDDIAMTDVWIVNENMQLITGPQFKQYSYADLPADAEIVVKEVFKGKTAFSEGFSKLLNSHTLTVGTPIMSGSKVVGALLLHSPIQGMNEAVTQGFSILIISILTALVLAIILSMLLALAFTKPLKKMKNTANRLAGGDYSAKTSVTQNDEIGELANAIDILSERLDLSSKESERLDKLRRDFVANISHELRTPVTVLRGSLEALCDKIVTEPEQVEKYHRQMLNESIFLQRLVNDLLDLSRLQNTDFKIDMHELNLYDVVSDVVRTAQHIALQKNIEILQLADTTMCKVTGDYGRLRQMLLVIVDNAIKFSQEGSTVTVSLMDKAVYVKDNGIGIASEDIPYIFDRFYKVKSESNKNGTGLGLAIAKQIADRHNITVSVSSMPNQGSEFLFKF